MASLKPHRVPCVLWVASSRHLPWGAVWSPDSLEAHTPSPADVKEQAPRGSLLARRPASLFWAHWNISRD